MSEMIIESSGMKQTEAAQRLGARRIVLTSHNCLGFGREPTVMPLPFAAARSRT